MPHDPNCNVDSLPSIAPQCNVDSCSFGKLHPALADKHYLRTSDENERLLDAKLRLQHSLEQQHLAGKRAARPATADGGAIRGSPDKRWAALRQVCLRCYAVLTQASCLTDLVNITIIWCSWE